MSFQFFVAESQIKIFVKSKFESCPGDISIRLKTTSQASLKKELKKYFWKVFLKEPKVTDMKDDIKSIRF